jgi:uncharacterized protein (DUF362 family)/Pyruvate/2-oxoacid:ferredoxin oxidoreductase delta subunit
MNNRVVLRKGTEYNIHEIYNIIEEIYTSAGGPEVNGKKVLIKPNILTDSDPSRCICTHPVVVEAMTRYLQSKGAEVFIGDSPAVHLRGFKPDKSGISCVCDRTGAKWVDFTKGSSELPLTKGKIRIASIAKEADLIISLPKFKNHELVYFTGAVKNTLGLVPGFSKAKQHALHHERNRFSAFLIDLNKHIMPHFFLMDGISGMEGPGPGQGTPRKMDLLVGSTNPVALDIIASGVAGYDPADIPTNALALEEGLWIKDKNDIIYDGPDLETITKKDFKRIPITRNENISLKFLRKRIRFLRKIERRPVFIHANCTACLECIKICPENAIKMHPVRHNHVVLTDSKCIRCFCCSEVCQSNAVEIRRKFFGV